MISSVRFRMPAFIELVLHIVQLSTEKQMIRSYAGRIVAGMENFKTFRYFSKVNHPTDTMSGKAFSRMVITTYINHAVCIKRITPIANCGGPDPTSFCLTNFVPKAIKYRVRKTLRDQIVEGICSLHQSVLLIVCHALGSSNRKGIFISITSKRERQANAVMVTRE